VVFVRAYTKRDGTHVREHTRSASTLAAAGWGTGLLIFCIVMWGFATHNISVHVPAVAVPTHTVRPTSVSGQFASRGERG
jgi:hypothetical protein